MVQWLFKMGYLISGSISLSRPLKSIIQLSIIIITRRKCPCYALGKSKFNALSQVNISECSTFLSSLLDMPYQYLERSCADLHHL